MKEYKSFYKTVGGNEGTLCKYPTRLDTYGCGCQHDCSYCYARSLLDFRNLWSPVPAVADIAKIEKKVRTLPRGTVLRRGMTDCFQPCEKLYRVTQETIRVLNECRIGYLIVTKSASVADYIDILDKDLAHIQITVTTLDDDRAVTYEHASVPSERVEAIKTLQDEGFDVAIRLSPLIEDYMDFDKLNGLGVEKAVVEFLRVNSWIQKWFDIDYSEYTVSSGGYWHLTLTEKRRIIDKIKLPSVTVCEDVPLHYDYWRNNFNPNPEDCCNLRGVMV